MIISSYDDNLVCIVYNMSIIPLPYSVINKANVNYNKS